MIVGHYGRITLALVDDQLVRLDGVRHRVLDRHVPMARDSLYVDDRAGRE